MADKPELSPLEALEREKARLLEQAAAIDRDMADLARYQELAAKYNYKLVPQDGESAQSTVSPFASKSASAVVTISDLIGQYKTHAGSAYQNLRFRTRGAYDGNLRRIEDVCGNKRPGELKKPDIEALHAKWMERGAATAHQLVTMLRGLANFGSTTLQDGECERLAVLLHTMRFEGVKARKTERLTERQVSAIINTANEHGYHSIALAQALQFYCHLRQTDVIGEWVPLGEAPEESSDVVYKGEKWIRGLCWEAIDREWVLRHKTSWGGKDIQMDLRRTPEVMTELYRTESQHRRGPLVIYEHDGRPYDAAQFRARWRFIAGHAGIPPHIKNMNSIPTARQANDHAGANGQTEWDTPPNAH